MAYNPDICEKCSNMDVRDRREDYGDVCMPFCSRLRVWLDFYESGDSPCQGTMFEEEGR